MVDELYSVLRSKLIDQPFEQKPLLPDGSWMNLPHLDIVLVDQSDETDKFDESRY